MSINIPLVIDGKKVSKKELRQRIAEAMALIVTSQPRDDYSIAAADHAERIAK